MHQGEVQFCIFYLIPYNPWTFVYRKLIFRIQHLIETKSCQTKQYTLYIYICIYTNSRICNAWIIIKFLPLLLHLLPQISKRAIPFLLHLLFAIATVTALIIQICTTFETYAFAPWVTYCIDGNFQMH